MAQGTCSICNRRGRIRRGWCDTHYYRWYRTGDPGPAEPLIIIGDDRARFESYVDHPGGPDMCHPWTGATIGDSHYGKFTVDGKSITAHDFAWELEHGEKLPKGHHVDHQCHNLALLAGTCTPGPCAHRLCCNGKHLVARTPAEHNGKVTNAQVIEIRVALAKGNLQRDIAAQFGISQQQVSRINTGIRRSQV